MNCFILQYSMREESVPAFPSLFSNQRLCGKGCITFSASAEELAEDRDLPLLALFSGSLLNGNALSTLFPEQKLFSNAELVLALYKKYGPEGVSSRLQGSFSAVVCDLASGDMICVTDRAGQQRVWYYSLPDGGIVISNSLAHLQKDPSFPGELSSQKIRDYMSLLYVPEGTVYEFLHALAPGETLFFSGKDHKVCRIAPEEKKEKEKFSLSYKESCEKFRFLLCNAVKKILENTPGPYGVFLSGGVDSAVTASITAQMVDGPLHCCSIAFQEKEYDEREGALRSAEHLRRVTGKEIIHHVFEVTPPKDFTFLQQMIGYYGQPFADSSLIAASLLCREASAYGSVFLGGDGADEFLCGYERYIAMRYLSYLDWMGDPLRKILCSGVTTLLPRSGGERKCSARLHRLFQAGKLPRSQRYHSLVSHTSEESKMLLFNKDFLAGTVPSAETFDPEGYFRTHKDCSVFDIRSYLCEDCLTKSRIASSAADLKLFSPFLQEDVMDFALSLPYSFKEKNAYRKRILCDSFAPDLYEGLGRSRKRGFGVPLAQWMRNQWKDLLYGSLLSGEGVKRGIFSSSGTEQLLKEHSASLKDHSYTLYCALILELFLREKV